MGLSARETSNGWKMRNFIVDINVEVYRNWDRELAVAIAVAITARFLYTYILFSIRRTFSSRYSFVWMDWQKIRIRLHLIETVDIWRGWRTKNNTHHPMWFIQCFPSHFMCTFSLYLVSTSIFPHLFVMFRYYSLSFFSGSSSLPFNILWCVILLFDVWYEESTNACESWFRIR